MKFKAGFFDGWLLALFVSACISIFTLLLLSRIHELGREVLLPVGVIVFWVAFVTVFAFMEFVVFREAKKIYKLTEKKKKKKELENTVLLVEKPGLFNPMRRVYDEVFSFTTLKEKEIEELKKLETFRRDFIADVSHELKTPLFAAQGFIHTLLDGAIEDTKVRTGFLNKAAKSLDGLEHLVRDLMTLSQIETGEIKMKFESVDIIKIVKETIEPFEVTATKRKISLHFDSKREEALVLADRQRISQVITNLLSNAFNYTQEGGEVKVKVFVTKKSVTTSIKDNGEGIPEEHLPRIFQRFYRVDKSRSREYGGTGLGLAIVKHILEGHRTKAEVESTPGKGSAFSFTLQRYKPD